MKFHLLSLFLLLYCAPCVQAYNEPSHAPHGSKSVFLSDCANAVAQIDLQINNVRARLTTGGDVWWDGHNGRYIVPAPPPGTAGGVSAIFAAALWMGGKDAGGNTKLAAQQYGRSSGQFDYYPGPLRAGSDQYPGGPLADPLRGTTDPQTCARWDKFFSVTSEDIANHIRQWHHAWSAGTGTLDTALLSASILGWPARGNRFFESVHQFPLPDSEQGLAAFWDQDFDGIYEPDLGDYPIADLRGCLNQEIEFPDELIFWIFNDAGGAHRESGAVFPLGVEVHAQSFAYRSGGDLNNATFQSYKIISRAIEQIDSTYIGFWVDPDLGCYTDDYVGCHPERNMAYIYNADAVDGDSNCVCEGDLPTYCDEIPILGIELLQGPFNQFGEELAMSSFTYHVPPSILGISTGYTSPQTPQEYHRYLSGRWRDGSPITRGGFGYQTDGPTTTFAFPDAPDDPDGWSMCSEGQVSTDFRTVQSAGPYVMQPGSVSQMLMGIYWVPDQPYPCPSLDRLLRVSDEARQKFALGCLHPMQTPDAPDVDWVELDREIVAVLGNAATWSNNADESFAQYGSSIPDGADVLYRFEGYKLYQFAGPNVTLADVDDPAKVRVVYQCDVQNGISQIFNWEPLDPSADETPTEMYFYVPKLMVDGADQGIRHTFSIKEDQFASGNDRRLVNHRKYYFTAVAYAHNNYLDFDQTRQGDRGQARAYIESRRNIGDGQNAFYTVTPRPVFGPYLQATVGEAFPVTRIDGVGTGRYFLDITPPMRDTLEALVRADAFGLFSHEVTYRAGAAPIAVRVYDPQAVVDGEYELTFTDADMDNDTLEVPTHWTLRKLDDPNAPVITAERQVQEENEQVISAYGISITLGQVAEPGAAPHQNPANGTRGYRAEYAAANAPAWLAGIPDEWEIPTDDPARDSQYFDYIRIDDDPDGTDDPNGAFSQLGNGFWVPYHLCAWRDRPDGVPYLTPAWMNPANNIVQNQSSLANLNNVDIVFTRDTSLWSRCAVVETMNPAYSAAGYSAVGGRRMFDLRASPSVGKGAGPDGLPLPDDSGTEGMGWFPGYAIDVETGLRLNIFFGENSVYSGAQPLGPRNGADMAFNPSAAYFVPPLGGAVSLFNYAAGGQHFVYVTNQSYDACAAIAGRLADGSAARKVAALTSVTWTGMLLASPNASLLPYGEGLIPNDVTVKLRVDNPYQVVVGTGDFNGYPTYRFKIKGKEPLIVQGPEPVSPLMGVQVVPNPYYAGVSEADYAGTDVVRIHNLPGTCTVGIYTLDGRLVQRFNRSGGDSPRTIIWDLRDQHGRAVGSGAYLIHVAAPGMGERTLKWFGVF